MFGLALSGGRVGAGRSFGFWLVTLLVLTMWSAKAQKFPPVTADELALKSVPGAENAPAVVLRSEDVTDDMKGSIQHYVRIKILNESGLKYANVALTYSHQSDNKEYQDIAARTIHPDGSVTMFTGKPHKRSLEKSKGHKVDETVFTLPSVEVGSIVEYRYTDPYSYLQPPSWDLQGELFVKEGLHVWFPNPYVRDGEGHALGAVSWKPLLPPGTQVERKPKDVASVLLDRSEFMNDSFVVRTRNIPPLPQETMMPPEADVRFSVRFNYAPTGGSQAFWNTYAARWFKLVDQFTVQKPDLVKATAELTAGASTEDAKLHRIYAAIMGMTNTDYQRTRGTSELKVEGIANPPSTVWDVWSRKQGTSRELVELFLAMARAAGIKASLIAVPDRRYALFDPDYLNVSMLAADIVMATADGKDILLDPGERYCEYGELAWQHTSVQGLKQNGKAVSLVRIPAGNPQWNRTARVAKLKLDEAGEVSGIVEYSFSGAPALKWRTEALLSDSQELREALKKSLSEAMDSGFVTEEVHVDNLTDSSLPLKVSMEVHGDTSKVGKRQVLALDPFVVRDRSGFTAATRTFPVMLSYPEVETDIVSVEMPAALKVAALPPADFFEIENKGSFAISVKQQGNTLQMQRRLTMSAVLILVDQYPELRDFARKVETRDADTILLEHATVNASK